MEEFSTEVAAVEALNSTFVDRGMGYVAYKLLLFLLLLCPIIILDLVILVVACFEKGITPIVRIVLVNIPLACLFIMVGYTSDHVAAVHLTFARNPQSPPPEPCYFIVYTIGLGAAARIVFMAQFAVTIFVVVRFGTKMMKPVVLVISSLLLWLFLILFNVVVVIPSIVGVAWDDGVSCRPFPIDEVATFSIIGVDLIVFGIVPFVLTIVMPILTYCYLKRNITTEDVNKKKVLVKFALFLILGNGLSVIGLIIPVLITTLSPMDSNPEVDEALLRLSNIITHLSLIPTPILILFYFKPIRMRLLSLLELIFCLACRSAGYDYRRKLRSIRKSYRMKKGEKSANSFSNGDLDTSMSGVKMTDTKLFMSNSS